MNINIILNSIIIKHKMVKNTGGNKTKGMARKNATSDKSNKILREPEHPDEIFAQVTKVLGGGMYNVICMDSVNRLCWSSGKFKGRNKKDNFVSLGSWLIVGIRSYETVKPPKLQNCDLLEVYNDIEKDKLKKTVQQNWAVFIENDNKNSFMTKTDMNSGEGFVFGDSTLTEYTELMTAALAKSSGTGNMVTVAGGDIINIDDI